jgi:putative effector of murein hydrolase
LNRLSTLVPVLLTAGSLLLLGGDLVQVFRGGLLWTFLLSPAFVCFAAGLLLLPVGFSLRRHPLVITGIACAFVGCFAGAGMQVLFRTWEVLQTANQTSAAELLRTDSALNFSTLVPGVFFPIGLLLLAIGLMHARALPLKTTVPLALGAVLFPIGHAAGVVPAIVIGDVVLLAAFSSLFGATKRVEA